MKTVKENIAFNICELRKNKKWTQAELAEKLNYTDKAISKWERGESTPDVEILYKMSELFGVRVDYFFHEDSSSDLNNYIMPKSLMSRRIAQLALILTSVWFVAIVLFVYSFLKERTFPEGVWIVFIWPIPICCFITILFFNRIKFIKGLPFAGSGLIWSLLIAVYLQGLIIGENVWLIFLVGIPIQIAIVIGYWLKK